MKPRRAFEVQVLASWPAGEDASVIRPEAAGWTLFVAGGVVARCGSAKRLADWAFEEGALEVRHDYDLRLSDGEA